MYYLNNLYDSFKNGKKNVGIDELNNYFNDYNEFSTRRYNTVAKKMAPIDIIKNIGVTKKIIFEVDVSEKYNRLNDAFDRDISLDLNTIGKIKRLDEHIYNSESSIVKQFNTNN
jgi:hypothetical protein